MGAATAVVLAGWVAEPSRAWNIDRLMKSARQLGPRAVDGANALAILLREIGPLDERRQLPAVNDFFNQRIVFVDDLEACGEVDHWASPLETLDRGVGDCEDYAIAKYFSLLAVGVPPRKLRLVYVRAQVDGAVQAHMVLAHYASANAEPVILDNLVGELLPASRRPDLTPVFSFNSEGLWEGTAGRPAGDPTTRLSRWRDVLARAYAEGFL